MNLNSTEEHQSVGISKQIPDRAREHLLNFVLDPRVYGPTIVAIVGFVGYLLYQHLEPRLARHIAAIVTQSENFPAPGTKDGSPRQHNPIVALAEKNLLESEALPERLAKLFRESPELRASIFSGLEGYLKDSEFFSEAVVNSIVSTTDDRLKELVRELIDDEVKRLSAIELEYGRVDHIFRKQFRITAGTRQELTSTFDFLADPRQRILIRLAPVIEREQAGPNGDPWVERVLRKFVVRGSDEVRVTSGVPYEITTIVEFHGEGEGVQLVEVAFWPERGVLPEDTLMVDATVIVRNSLPAYASQEDGGSGPAPSLLHPKVPVD